MGFLFLFILYIYFICAFSPAVFTHFKRENNKKYIARNIPSITKENPISFVIIIFSFFWSCMKKIISANSYHAAMHFFLSVILLAYNKQLTMGHFLNNIIFIRLLAFSTLHAIVQLQKQLTASREWQTCKVNVVTAIKYFYLYQNMVRNHQTDFLCMKNIKNICV